MTPKWTFIFLYRRNCDFFIITQKRVKYTICDCSFIIIKSVFEFWHAFSINFFFHLSLCQFVSYKKPINALAYRHQNWPTNASCQWPIVYSSCDQMVVKKLGRWIKDGSIFLINIIAYFWFNRLETDIGIIYGSGGIVLTHTSFKIISGLTDYGRSKMVHVFRNVRNPWFAHDSFSLTYDTNWQII